MARQWTDAELIELCRAGADSAFTDDAVAAIRDKLEHANELREAVRNSPNVDLLCRRLGLTKQQLRAAQRISPGQRFALGIAGTVALIAVVASLTCDGGGVRQTADATLEASATSNPATTTATTTAAEPATATNPATTATAESATTAKPGQNPAITPVDEVAGQASGTAPVEPGVVHAVAEEPEHAAANGAAAVDIQTVEKAVEIADVSPPAANAAKPADAKANPPRDSAAAVSVIADSVIANSVIANSEAADSTVAALKPPVLGAANERWSESLDPDKPPRPFEDVAWLSPGIDSPDTFPPDEFRDWFEAIPGRPFSVLDENSSNRIISRFEGVARFRAPFVESSVLRLGMFDVERLSWYFWQDQRGLRLRYYPRVTPNVLAIHEVTRNDDKAPPHEGAFISHDCGRWQISNQGTFDIRFDGQRLTLVRGNVRLLSVPFAGWPDDVELDGKLKFRRLEMLRSNPLPEAIATRFDLPIGRALLTTEIPAGLNWQSAPKYEPAVAEFRGAELTTPPPTANATQPAPEPPKRRNGPPAELPAGSVELSVQSASREVNAVSVPVPDSGLCEFVFRVGQMDPGTAVCVGLADGTPAYRLTAVWDPAVSRTGLVLAVGAERPGDVAFNPDQFPPPWIAPSQWLRIITGGGSVSIWSSPDGENWGWIGASARRGVYDRFASVGISVQPGGDRTIRLDQVAVREFATLPSLADPGLLARIERSKFEPLELFQPADWLHRCLQTCPADVEFPAWRRACAVAALRAVAEPQLHLFLLNGLISDAAFGSDFEERRAADSRFVFNLLGESGLFADLWETIRGQRHMQMYHEVARQRVLSGNSPRDAAQDSGTQTSLASEALLSHPFWSGRLPAMTPDQAARIELVQLVEAGEYRRALQLIDEIVFWNDNAHPGRPWWTPVDSTYPMVVWAELSSNRILDGETQAQRTTLSGRWKTPLIPLRHPLAQPVSKEAYNVMAEFKAAIDGGAFADACQVISSAGSADLLGLLPDSVDDRLMVSFPNAVALAMDGFPQLRRSMNEQYGAVGRLRVRQAIEAGDHRMIEAATVQFYGTPAAAESDLWLADRALAGGQFAQARSFYRRALAGFQNQSAIEPPEQQAIAGRLRLVAGMLGESPVVASPGSNASPVNLLPVDPPVTTPATFASSTLAPAQLEQLATELAEQARQQANATITGQNTRSSNGQFSVPWLPPPGRLKAELKAHYEGDAGESAGNGARADIDWFARQIAWEVDGTLAYVCNRYQLSCLDLTNGQTKWSQPLGGEHGNAHHWQMLPMRPLLTATSVVSRRLTKQGPQLVCCRRENGEILWQQRPEQTLVSDPFLVRGTLQVFAAQAANAGPTVLNLLTIHPESGTVTESVPVLTLLDSWADSVPSCQVTAREGLIYFATAGAVGACDSHGQMLWVRRLQWMPPAYDARYRYLRTWTPPMLDGERLITTDPEALSIECLDTRSGRLIWRHVAPELTRIIAMAAGRLIYETRFGLSAINADSGQPEWTYLAADLMAGIAVLDPRLAPAPATPPPATPPQPVPAPPAPHLLVARSELFIDGRTRLQMPTLVRLDLATGRELSRIPLNGLKHTEPLFGPLIGSADHLWAFYAQGRKEVRRQLLDLHPADDGDIALISPNPERWASWHVEHQRATLPDNLIAWSELYRIPTQHEYLAAVDRLAPGWMVFPTAQPGDAGYRAEHRGQKEVLAFKAHSRQMTDAQREQLGGFPVQALRYVTEFEVPDVADPRLRLRAAHDPGEEWILTIEANGQLLHNSYMNNETVPAHWQTIQLDLSRFRHQRLRLVVAASVPDKAPAAWAYFSEFQWP